MISPLDRTYPTASAASVSRSLLVATACLAIVLASCGGASKDKPASQVAAKVNKEEISVHQINFVLQQQRGLKADQADAASRQVLERLIDQEIAIQKAQEKVEARNYDIRLSSSAGRHPRSPGRSRRRRTRGRN